ncbi:MAG TPA: GNVR domain-containing protein [Polyangiales bacterium]|nr:GNVR domain-containing protein [Polyangiales bacterium]
MTPNDRESRDSIVPSYEGPRNQLGHPRHHVAVQAPPSQLPLQPPSNNIDVGTLFKAIAENWRFIARVGFSIMLVVLAATLLMRMSFKATGRLYLGELDNKAQSAGQRNDLDLLGGASGEVASEIEIMRSHSLVKQAIASAGLNVTVRPKGWKPPRLYKWLLVGRDPSEIRGAAGELSASDAALGEGILEPQKLQVRFDSPTEYQVSSDGHALGKGTLDRPLTLPLASFTLHRGDRGTPAPGSEYDLEVNGLDATLVKALDDLTITAAKLSASGGEQVKVVTLDYLNRNPILAATFLRELMRVYLDERQKWKTADATAAESFVKQQLAEMRGVLDGTQQKLADYRANTDGVVMDNEAKSMIEQVAKYEEQRVQARLQVAALSDIKRALKDPGANVEAYLLGEASDTVLEGLGKSLSTARQNLTELQGKFLDTAPDVRNAKAQIAAQTETVRNYVTGRLARAQENLGTLTNIIGQFQDKLKTVPGAEVGLAQIARESDVYSKLYSQLLERQQQAAILKASTVSKNRVLDRPEAPVEESSPKLLLAFASGVLGLVIGMCIVLFQRFAATTLQSEQEVRAIAGGAPVLASVPKRSMPAEREQGFDSLMGERVSGSAEAFRGLRASIYQSSRQGAGSVILITSPSQGDGKTLTALSLAAVLAADQKWVLVIDADLRNPTHHMLTGGDDSRGLRGILNGQHSWRDAVRPVAGQFGEFFSIGAGRPTPGELSGERMARFLMEARSRYDFVLIDGPSFPLVADPLVLAPLADQVISVMRLRHTLRADAVEHVQKLAPIAAHGLSVVVNDAAPVVRRGQRTPPSNGSWAKLWGRDSRQVGRLLPPG